MNSRQPLVLLTFCWCIACDNAFAQATPTDVYERGLQVATEINFIRLEMGVADASRPDIAIGDAQPREVYFQALTLFEKSNRLLFEQLRERKDPPALSSVDITPDDVLTLVDASLELILRIKNSFGIIETVTVKRPNNTQTPTDVYVLIVSLNRTLNTLLQRQFAPADVYQQITYGVGLAAAILATITSTDRLGREPALIRRKTPLDVYRRLITIYTSVHETMQLTGIKCLVIEPTESERTDINPSDVYDMASLLVAELSYLHSLTERAAPAKESYFPGDKFPSHVYQRAGRLKSQVKMLRNYVSTHPAWLKNM